MNNSHKLTMAALLLGSSLQVQASDFDLDITASITQGVTQYVQQASHELKQSVLKSLELDAKGMFIGEINNKHTQEAEKSAADKAILYSAKAQ
ncbi:hypothetical protein [Pseudoalteromonas mariniglutinosa]|uniref:hypothetical protein n=1 Tax=Pseudoalteromonas mariniglutinosa TaxID=206042 RepID=UPI0038508758